MSSNCLERSSADAAALRECEALPLPLPVLQTPLLLQTLVLLQQMLLLLQMPLLLRTTPSQQTIPVQQQPVQRMAMTKLL